MSDEKTNISADDFREMVKQCYDDREMTIHGRTYEFGPINHKKRLPIYAYLSQVAGPLSDGDMSFMGTPEWVKIEQSICSVILFEKSQITKLPTHWDKYPEDYLMFCTTALSVISYPFLAGSPTA